MTVDLKLSRSTNSHTVFRFALDFLSIYPVSSRFSHNMMLLAIHNNLQSFCDTTTFTHLVDALVRLGVLLAARTARKLPLFGGFQQSFLVKCSFSQSLCFFSGFPFCSKCCLQVSLNFYLKWRNFLSILPCIKCFVVKHFTRYFANLNETNISTRFPLSVVND